MTDDTRVYLAGHDVISWRNCRDVYLPGGKPTAAASFWSVQLKGALSGSPLPELSSIKASLEQHRIVVLASPDRDLLDEIFEVLAAALFDQDQAPLDVYSSEFPRESADQHVISWLRKLLEDDIFSTDASGRRKRTLVRLAATEDSTFGTVRALLQLGKFDLRRITEALSDAGAYLVVPAGLPVSPEDLRFAARAFCHRIDFVELRLRKTESPRWAEVLMEFRHQKLRGWWPEAETELFDQLYPLFGDPTALIEAIDQRAESRRRESPADVIPVGAAELEIETVAIFVAVFLPGLSRTVFGRLVQRLALPADPAGTLPQAREEGWRLESTALLARCRIAASPRPGESWTAASELEVHLEKPEYREHYRRVFLSVAFAQYVHYCECLFRLEPIFDPDPRLRQTSARLLAELHSTFPDRFSELTIRQWVMGWIDRMTAGEENGSRPKDPSPGLARLLEALFQAGIEIRKFDSILTGPNGILETLLEGRHWRTGARLLLNLRHLPGFDPYLSWIRYLKRPNFRPGSGPSGVLEEKIRRSRLREDLKWHAISGSEALGEAFKKLGPYLKDFRQTRPEEGFCLDARSILIATVVECLKGSRAEADSKDWGSHALAGAFSTDPPRFSSVVDLILGSSDHADLRLHVLTRLMRSWILPDRIVSEIGTASRGIMGSFRKSVQAWEEPAGARLGLLLLLTWLVADAACSRYVGNADWLRTQAREVFASQLSRSDRRCADSLLVVLAAANQSVATELKRKGRLANQDPDLVKLIQEWTRIGEVIGKLRFTR